MKLKAEGGESAKFLRSLDQFIETVTDFMCKHKKWNSLQTVRPLEPLKILNGIKLILDDQGNHLDSYTISLKSYRSFTGPLFRKPVTGQEEHFLLSLTANQLYQFQACS